MEPENQTPNQAPQNNVPQQPEPAAPKPPSKGYGKRPIWQWVLIYVVVAIVVYGVIYFLFIHKSGGGSSY